jgi:hypothetical protein
MYAVRGDLQLQIGKGKGILKPKALPWAIQWRFDAKVPSLAKPFDGKCKGTLKAKARHTSKAKQKVYSKAKRRQKSLLSSNAKAVPRQSVNCTTVTGKHPLFSQTLESWYGWVGRCCISHYQRVLDRQCCRV